MLVVSKSVIFFTLFGRITRSRSDSLVVEGSTVKRYVGRSIPGSVKQICGSSALLSAQHMRVRDRVAGSDVLGWDTLPTRGVVFQWASTVNTGRGSD